MKLDEDLNLPYSHLRDLHSQNVVSSSQFNRDQLRHLFNLANEMKKIVKKQGSVNLLKVSEVVCYVEGG